MLKEYVNEVKNSIRTIPNFPKEGIMFRDITTTLKDANAMKKSIDYIVEMFKDEKIDYVVGLESRGFIFGMPVAYLMNVGFIPIRKPNKLPGEVIKVSYELEYGTDTLEMHADAIKKGDRVLVIDDLLATGGTAAAACNLLSKVGADIVGCAFVIELDDLHGREKLPKNSKVITMVHFEGE